jgi:hypothetical protein
MLVIAICCGISFGISLIAAIYYTNKYSQVNRALKIKKDYLLSVRRFQQEEELQQLIFDLDCEKQSSIHTHKTIQ